MTNKEKEVYLILHGWYKEFAGQTLRYHVCEWIDPKRPGYIFDLEEAYKKVCQNDQ